MLLEEQVAELLKRCESILGRELSQTRGNLRTAQNRAAAVWELLVIEASAKIGEIEYEPEPDGSLDIRLTTSGGRQLWIEASYLEPRFLKEERLSRAITAWIFVEAKRRNIPGWKIRPRFDGRKTTAGSVRKLPKLNERHAFLNGKELRKFFDDVASCPTNPHTCTLSNYTVSVSYLPNAEGPYVTSEGLVQEAPTRVKEHALYRKLRGKASQSALPAPKIICIGSDCSPVLSKIRAPGVVSVQDAISAAFRQHASLSAVILVSIQSEPVMFGGTRRKAKAEIVSNPTARCPLLVDELKLLQRLNFNCWKYTYPFAKWEYSGPSSVRFAGTMRTEWRCSPMELMLEIPSPVMLDILAGKTSLTKEYGEDKQLGRALEEGWSIASCSMKEAKIEEAESTKIVFTLVPPPPGIFKKNQR